MKTVTTNNASDVNIKRAKSISLLGNSKGDPKNDTKPEESIMKLADAFNSSSEGADPYFIMTKKDYVLSHIVYEENEHSSKSVQIKAKPNTSKNKERASSKSKFKPIKTNTQQEIKAVKKEQLSQKAEVLLSNNSQINVDGINTRSVNQDEINDLIHNLTVRTQEKPVHNHYENKPMKAEAKEKELPNVEIPLGKRLLSEQERLLKLELLNSSKSELEAELFKMPIVNKTRSIQNRKAELEKKLSEIESEINKYSRKIVFENV